MKIVIVILVKIVVFFYLSFSQSQSGLTTLVNIGPAAINLLKRQWDSGVFLYASKRLIGGIKRRPFSFYGNFLIFISAILKNTSFSNPTEFDT